MVLTLKSYLKRHVSMYPRYWLSLINKRVSPVLPVLLLLHNLKQVWRFPVRSRKLPLLSRM